MLFLLLQSLNLGVKNELNKIGGLTTLQSTENLKDFI